MLRKKYVWAVIYSLILISFTTYAALDTFVIARVQKAAVSEERSSEGQAASAEDTTASIGKKAQDNSAPDLEIPFEIAKGEKLYDYDDADIKITLTKLRCFDTDIFIARLTLSSPEFLRTALAGDAFGRNVTERVSEIAGRNNAILAVNGDFYGSQQRGYVVRNGVLYRESAVRSKEDLVILSDGSFEIINEDESSAKELLENGAMQVLSFGPALVQEGQITVSNSDEVGKAMASNPRTAIAVTGELAYLFVVSDGRTEQSTGLSLYQLAGIIQQLGAQTAYNLDGGGSSTLYFNGEVINTPTTTGRSTGERKVSDIVYIGR